jgi:acetoacetyl-CoA reductase
MSKVAVVTGGTRGIGGAISKALKAEGYQVAANYAGNDAAAAAFADETGIEVFKWSVASYEECAAGIEAVVAKMGSVDVLVNNAGITRDSAFHKMTPQQWRDVIDTNLNGLFNMTHQVWNGMREKNFGRIINISSINGQKGQFGQANYSSAKAGDLGFTKALAQEGAAKGITVNAICPGYIGTDMVLAIPEDVRAKIVAQIPVGRLGTPEEIARCVMFLASDAAGFITGSTLSANGGQYFA